MNKRRFQTVGAWAARREKASSGRRRASRCAPWVCMIVSKMTADWDEVVGRVRSHE